MKNDKSVPGSTKHNTESTKGTYILILHVYRNRVIQVGKLGTFKFPAGYYAYVGSAFGPGGLSARIKHHFNQSRSLRWHIDYLRKKANPVQIWSNNYTQKLEHRWAAALLQSRRTTVPVPGFGSSDCRCGSHLFRLSGPHSLTGLKRTLQQAAGNLHRVEFCLFSDSLANPEVPPQAGRGMRSL